MSVRCSFPVFSCSAAYFAYLALGLLLIRPGSLHAQPTSEIRITKVSINDSHLQIEYQEGEQRGSRQFPVAVLTSLLRQTESMPRTSSTSTKAVTGIRPGARATPTQQPNKHGDISVASPQTGLTYKAHLIADSLVQVEYETEAGLQSAELPVHVLTFLHQAHAALSGKPPPDVSEAYIDFKTWSFWFNIAQHYDFRLVLALFVAGMAGLVFVPFRLWVRRVERERDAIAASRQRLVEAREAERSHLSAELHDGPIQILQQTLRTVAPVTNLHEEEVIARLDQVQHSLEQVTGELRNLCTELRPPVLVHFGLDKALRSYVQVFLKRYDALAVDLDLTPEQKTLPFPVRLALFRIGQEALNNVGKHAHAQRIQVTFRLAPNRIVLTVKDDGCGFRPPRRWIELEEQGHLGLSGIAQRAEAIGGRLEVESVLGQGTVLRVEAPRPPAASQVLDSEAT